MHAFDLSAHRARITCIRRAWIALAVLLALMALPAFAQTDTGAIVGMVQDNTNARVPGATVDVTDTATGVTRTYTTNGEGEYEALQLIPGVYSVTVKHGGFATAVRKNITVNVQGRVQVDFELSVSGGQQEVVVNEATAELQTQSAEVSGVMPSQELNDLPLNGRDYDNLVLTSLASFVIPPWPIRPKAASAPTEISSCRTTSNWTALITTRNRRTCRSSPLSR